MTAFITTLRSAARASREMAEVWNREKHMTHPLADRLRSLAISSIPIGADNRTMLNEAIAEIEALTARLEAWKALANGRAILLMAYRTGTPPSEKAHKLIDKARVILGPDALLEQT